MSSVTVYILTNSGHLDCTRSGDVDSVMLAIDIEEKEYTLQSPPDFDGGWRWVDNQWIADETADQGGFLMPKIRSDYD